MVIWFKLDNKPHKPGIDKKKPYFQQVGCSFPNPFIASSKPPHTMSLVFLSSPLSGHDHSDANHRKGIGRREWKKSRVVILHVDIPGVDEIAGASKPQLVYFVTCNVKPTKLTNMGRPRILE